MAGAVVVPAFDIFGPGLAVTDVHSDVIVFRRDPAYMPAHGMVNAVARAMYKPGRPVFTGIDDGVEHADHGSQPHPAAEQNHRSFLLWVEEKVAA